MSLVKRTGAAGAALPYPLQTILGPAGTARQFLSPVWYQHLGLYWFFEDFLFDEAPDDLPWTAYDKSAAGSPTVGLVASGTGGQWQMKCAATSEAETLAWYFNDNLPIRGNVPFLFACRAKVVHTMAANQVVVIGLGSALVDTFDDMTRNAWFKLDADADWNIEYDDNTTNVDDQDIGEDVVADTFYWFFIEFDGTELRFHLGSGDGQNIASWNGPKNFSQTEVAFGANNLQPFIAVQKASGTTTPEVVLDLVAFCGVRV